MRRVWRAAQVSRGADMRTSACCIFLRSGQSYGHETHHADDGADVGSGCLCHSGEADRDRSGCGRCDRSSRGRRAGRLEGRGRRRSRRGSGRRGGRQHALLFNVDSDVLKAGAVEKLASLGDILAKYPNNKIEVRGYTDATGSEKYNEALSLRRAEAVRKVLMERGVAEAQMMAIGMGKTEPVASNTTPEGRFRFGHACT